MDQDYFLFSIDLEDVRLFARDGLKYAPRVDRNMERYLSFADEHGFRFTCFTVGNIAELYPVLLKRIHEAGHEIACHSNSHTNLDQLDAAQFRKDLLDNIDALRSCGIAGISGYRAPVFSLTPQNSGWIYPALKEAGIEYSSSVLPAKNPLFGWEGFGQNPRMTKEGIVELPITITSLGIMKVPLGGGVYFRVLPLPVLKAAHYFFFRKNRFGVTSYFHPYDIDTGQEKFPHGNIDSKFYNFLMYYNRGSVFKKLGALLRRGYRIVPYREYVQKLRLYCYV